MGPAYPRVMGYPIPVGIGLAGVCFAIYLIISENRKLQRAAQRYRELEHEGLEALPAPDPTPEFARRRGTIRLPDGTEADAGEILREDLNRLRAFQERSSRPDPAPAESQECWES